MLRLIWLLLHMLRLMSPMLLMLRLIRPMPCKLLMYLLLSVAHWESCLPVRLVLRLLSAGLLTRRRRALPRPYPHPLACTCRLPRYVQRRFLEPEPLTRQRASLRLDAPRPPVGPGLGDLLSDESYSFPRHR